MQFNFINKNKKNPLIRYQGIFYYLKKEIIDYAA